MTADPDRMAQLTASAHAALANAFDRHERVFLSFSGGKDSLALLHLCDRWRSRLVLLWSNSGFMTHHMTEFVRGHANRYSFVEVSPNRPMLEHWTEHGTPADIVPIGHLEGLDWSAPRLQPWPLCCEAHRTRPLVTYMRGVAGPAAFINGQREPDKGTTPARMREVMPPHVETVMPIWDWSTSDVLTYLACHAVQLPPHHAVFQDSFECAICPADVKAGRLRVLDQVDPHAAAFVRATARIALGLVADKARQIEAALAETAPASSELRPCGPMSSASPADPDHRRHST